jgi:ribosome-associated protein
VAQHHRTQERNRSDARERLFDLIREAAVKPTVRRATKPTKASKTRRLEGKKVRSNVKALRRGRPGDD